MVEEDKKEAQAKNRREKKEVVTAATVTPVFPYRSFTTISLYYSLACL